MKSLSNKISFVSLILILSFCASLKAQRKSADIGLFAGVNTSWGDFTTVNYSKSLAPSFKFFYRYNFNPRLALKLNAGYNQIKLAGQFNGIDLNTEPDFVANSKKTMFSATAQLQVNFLKYILGHQEFKFSPYMAIGVGANYFDYNLFQKAITAPTPGSQPILAKEPLSGNKLALTIPFSIGLNYNINDKLAIGLEWNLHKIFADELDNLSDPYGIDATTLLQNNDWFSSFGVQISYLLYLGKKECPGYE